MEYCREDRSEAQAVETAVALGIGIATYLAVLFVSWIVALAAGTNGMGWAAPMSVIGIAMGIAATVWRLLGARRCGL